MPVSIITAPPEFNRWQDVHALLTESFAYMADRIDPPSSLLHMTAETLAKKARRETLLLAMLDDRIVGCLFLRTEPGTLYAGKLAVDAEFRGHGIARRLLNAAAERARESGLPALELQTRIELTENHQAFARLGFVKRAETTHEGFDRPTSITMRKPV